MVSVPKISVVMPAYNAARYLDEAVMSILNQTFRDFEFIIINDGSTDETVSILRRYERLDSRVIIYHRENQGMIPALNYGCRLARGKYIARMDADDISLPSRLERQVEYIERNPDVGIVGTWTCTADENANLTGTWCPPTNSKLLKWTNFFGVCVAHPSVLMGRQIMQKLNFYRSEASHGEDVDLWLRASEITEFGNVPEILHKYRVWGGSASQAAWEARRDVHARLLSSFIKDFLGFHPLLEAVEGLRRTRVGPPFENLSQIRLTADLIEKLYHKFVQDNPLSIEDRREVSWDAAKRLGSMALQASRLDAVGFVSLFMLAVKLDHRLLYPSVMLKGLERAFQP